MAEVTIEDKTKKQQEQEPTLFQYGDATYKLDDIIKAAKQDYNKRYYYSMLDTNSVDSKKLNNAINVMIQGLDERWIGYNPNNGNFVIYGDRKNITNDPEHYYGMASWYLKHMIIQNLTPYDKEKEEEKEAIKHGKIKYEGLESLQNYFRKQLVGNGLTKQNFINLDEYNSETGSRAVTNRTARVNTAINDMINKFGDYFYGYSDRQKDEAITELKKLQQKITGNDTSLDINEFSDFERVLGANLSKDESNPITWAELFNTTWNGKSAKLDDTTEYDTNKKREAFNKWMMDQKYDVNRNYKTIKIDLNEDGSLDLDTASYLKSFLDAFVKQVIERDEVKQLLYALAERKSYLQEVMEGNIKDYDKASKTYNIQNVSNIYALNYLLQNNNIKSKLKEGIVQNNIKMKYDEENKCIILYWIGNEKGYLKKEFDKQYNSQNQSSGDNTEDYYIQYYTPAQSVAQKKKEEEEDEYQES